MSRVCRLVMSGALWCTGGAAGALFQTFGTDLPLSDSDEGRSVRTFDINDSSMVGRGGGGGRTDKTTCRPQTLHLSEDRRGFRCGIHGGSVGDPWGILGGSCLKTRDPGRNACVKHMGKLKKVRGSNPTSDPLYNIIKADHRK